MFLLYKTTNLLNGKVYIGIHECGDTCRHLVDSKCMYFGSGSAIGRALKKYGKENFMRETLAEFSTEAQVLAEEARIVDEAWVKSSTNYNMALGGGKPPSRKGSITSQATKEKISVASKSRSAELSRVASNTMAKRMANGGWTTDEIKTRIATRRSTVGFPTEMNACNTKEAIAKRVATRKVRGYVQDISYLHSPDVTFRKIRTRIINQMKKGKTFNEEVLLKYNITSEDTQDILPPS